MRRDRRGNVAVMTGLLAIPLVGMAGLATDGARAWVLQSRLYTALDAAALAAARNVSSPAAQRDAEAAGMFWTNFASRPGGSTTASVGSAQAGFLGSTASFQQPQVVGTDIIQVRATATIPAYFTRVLGFSTLTVSATSQARRADLGLEVALVLDVTGSMDTGCGTGQPSNRTGADCGATSVPRSPGETRAGLNNNMDLLRLAAADLVNVLYGNRDAVPNLWVSVVPYTTTINVGPSRTGWLDPTARASLDADFSPTAWRGCVEARLGYAGAPSDGDLVDYAPSEAAFRPYLWQSTLGAYVQNGNAVPGDNDWARRLWASNTTGQNAITEDYQLWRGNWNVGPNLGCPQTPVLPLTGDKPTILDTIQALRPTFRGGTMINLGLLGGWFTLSPRWRTAWNLGAAPPGQATPLPLDYGARYMRKAVVLMTDGNNSWHDGVTGFPGDCTSGRNTTSVPSAGPGPAQHLQPTACPATSAGITVRSGAPPISGNKDYSGYGRPSDARVAESSLDSRTLSICTRMKAAGITIYTVIVNTSGGVSTATQTLYRNCASAPANALIVSQADQIRPAFQQIGQQLANLRLVQ